MGEVAPRDGGNDLRDLPEAFLQALAGFFGLAAQCFGLIAGGFGGFLLLAQRSMLRWLASTMALKEAAS